MFQTPLSSSSCDFGGCEPRTLGSPIHDRYPRFDLGIAEVDGYWMTNLHHPFIGIIQEEPAQSDEERMPKVFQFTIVVTIYFHFERHL